MYASAHACVSVVSMCACVLVCLSAISIVQSGVNDCYLSMLHHTL